jgi:hypothetical protein
MDQRGGAAVDEYRPEFDEPKFRNLILYIAQRGWGDPTLGKTKLWKILWMSDFLAYARTGESITGATYHHMPHGPAPGRGDRVIRHIQIHEELRGGYMQQSPLAEIEPDLDGFSARDIAIVEEAYRQFDGMSATEASALAHEISVGWKLTEDGERIPYETVFLSPEEPTADDQAWAEEMISERSA